MILSPISTSDTVVCVSIADNIHHEELNPLHVVTLALHQLLEGLTPETRLRYLRNTFAEGSIILHVTPTIRCLGCGVRREYHLQLHKGVGVDFVVLAGFCTGAKRFAHTGDSIFSRAGDFGTSISTKATVIA